MTRIFHRSLLALVAAAFASTAAQAADVGRYLEHESVPGRVKRAVETLNALGTQLAASYEIAHLDSYTLVRSSAEPRLKKILTDAIEATQAHGEWSLFRFCRDEKGFDDVNECADWLARSTETREPQLAFYFHTQVLTDAGTLVDADRPRLESSVASILALVGDRVGGDDYEEVTIDWYARDARDGAEKSFYTSVLVNKRKGHVVIVQYKLGEF